MPNLGLKHIFELNSAELFIKINNKWYFEIVFPVKNLEYERWILGKIFMRKYPIKFSPFDRLIGFYIKSNEGETEKEKEKKEKEKEIEKINNNMNSSRIYIYIIIIIVALVFTCVGLFLGKKIF